MGAALQEGPDSTVIDSEDLDIGKVGAGRWPVSRPGDVWSCIGVSGEHRVGYGDGRDADFVARLFDGETAQAASGDAPYNLKIAGDVFGLGKRTHEEFVMGSGKVAMA